VFQAEFFVVSTLFTAIMREELLEQLFDIVLLRIN
jgi:hypothetical protein